MLPCWGITKGFSGSNHLLQPPGPRHNCYGCFWPRATGHEAAEPCRKAAPNVAPAPGPSAHGCLPYLLSLHCMLCPRCSTSCSLKRQLLLHSACRV